MVYTIFIITTTPSYPPIVHHQPTLLIQSFGAKRSLRLHSTALVCRRLWREKGPLKRAPPLFAQLVGGGGGSEKYVQAREDFVILDRQQEPTHGPLIFSELENQFLPQASTLTRHVRPSYRPSQAHPRPSKALIGLTKPILGHRAFTNDILYIFFIFIFGCYKLQDQF